ncbi:motility-associated ABC transporter substrate-binding family protein [Novosphingobium gossypii]|uniref:ABC transporter n=1 Tax=Novosphingobium gossypii TaxID=1604774 RepID=UPI003D1F72E3
MAMRRAPLLMLCLLLAACGQGSAVSPEPKRQGGGTIGLYSSLPIAWHESDDIKGFLADDQPPHWALETLGARGRVVLLDTLADPQGALPLTAAGTLVLAQPRPLTAQENVALDAWVRGGGRVLLFVDAMLTGHSLFAPGDPRRPQDVAMLSPILSRWGLELTFDDGQEAGERMAGPIPVNLPGILRPLGKSGGASGKAGDVVAQCRIEVQGLVADCLSGKGRIVAVADAALLENPPESSALEARQAALARLLDRLAR